LPESNVAVARQYAEAVFQLAVEGNKVDRWSEELRLAAQVLSDPQVRAALSSPAVAEAEKYAVVRRSLSALDPLLQNLLLLLIHRRRLGFLGLITAEYGRLVNERRGIVLADVTTAVPLDDGQQDAVKQRLSSALGKQVRLRLKVDPSIIGGMVVQIGDRLINGSIAGRLASLRRELV